MAKAKDPRPFGTIEKLPSGRFRAYYELPGSGRKRIRAPRTFKDRKNARKWLRDEETAHDNGTWVSPEERQREIERQQQNTVGALVEKWWSTSQPWAPSEMDAQRNRYQNHVAPRFANTPLTDINSRMVANWLENLETIPRGKEKPRKASPATRKKCFELMRRIMSEARDRELIETNPLIDRKHLQNLTKPQDGDIDTTRKTRLWTPQEIKAVIDTVPEHLRTLFVLLAVCGLRAQEVRPLQPKDFDFEAGTLAITHTVTGTGKSLVHRDATKTRAGTRTIPLNASVVQEVKEHCIRQGIVTQSQFLFTAQDDPNVPIPIDTIREHAKRACKQLEFADYINPHSFRHAAITYGQRIDGVILFDVKQYFGHKRSSDITERYTHSDLKQQRLIANGLASLILTADSGVIPLRKAK